MQRLLCGYEEIGWIKRARDLGEATRVRHNWEGIINAQLMLGQVQQLLERFRANKGLVNGHGQDAGS